MSPPLAIDYLYAAFAENSACGPTRYEDAARCGAAATAPDGDGPVTDREVIDAHRQQGVATPPLKGRAPKGTPDTSPDTSVGSISLGSMPSRSDYIPFIPGPVDDTLCFRHDAHTKNDIVQDATYQSNPNPDVRDSSSPGNPNFGGSGGVPADRWYSNFGHNLAGEEAPQDPDQLARTNRSIFAPSPTADESNSQRGGNEIILDAIHRHSKKGSDGLATSSAFGKEDKPGVSANQGGQMRRIGVVESGGKEDSIGLAHVGGRVQQIATKGEKTNEEKSLKEKASQTGEEVNRVEGELKSIESNVNALLESLPNLLDDVVPDGEDAEPQVREDSTHAASPASRGKHVSSMPGTTPEESSSQHATDSIAPDASHQVMDDAVQGSSYRDNLNLAASNIQHGRKETVPDGIHKHSKEEIGELVTSSMFHEEEVSGTLANRGERPDSISLLHAEGQVHQVSSAEPQVKTESVPLAHAPFRGQCIPFAPNPTVKESNFQDGREGVFLDADHQVKDDIVQDSSYQDKPYLAASNMKNDTIKDSSYQGNPKIAARNVKEGMIQHSSWKCHPYLAISNSMDDSSHRGNRNITADNTAPTIATLSMFSKEDIAIITPSQIASYLTLDERKRIGTRVLTSKLHKGYALADSRHVCGSCGMPMLMAHEQLAPRCHTCPALKKRVLRRILDRILDGTADGTVSVGSSSEATASTLETVDLSESAEDLSLKRDDEDGKTIAPAEDVQNVDDGFELPANAEAVFYCC